MRNSRHNAIRLELLLILSGLMLAIAAPAGAHHCKGAHASDPGCDPGGGGGGGEDTSAIPLNCILADAPGDSFLSDGLLEYEHDVDKVICRTGDSQPNKDPSHVRFYTLGGGNVRQAVRKVDFVIDESTCTNPAGCAVAPDGFFEVAAEFDDMEQGRFWVRAYDGELGSATPHIQDLPPDATYDVTMGFDVLGTAERWSFQLNSRAANCNLEGPAVFSDDATLYVWPDDDMDGKPDGYTFTSAAAANIDTSSLPPTVNVTGSRTATLCSNVGIDGSGCDGPGGSDLCHLISQMEVQFTWHAVKQ